MAIYLTHKIHGTHIAITQDEVDICLSNGWELQEDKRVPIQHEDLDKILKVITNTPKRGRPKAK